MIPKTLISGYNDNDIFPPSTIIPSFSRGFDNTVLKKRASMFTDVIKTFERKPGYEYIHLISVADGRTYGPNSRADFYNGEPYEIEIPHPEKGSAKVIVLDGGISKYHKTFMDAGGVYTEHRNKHSVNPPKSQGYIVAQAYNQPMKRGELIIGVNDEAWRDDLDALSKGHPMKFSIGFDAAKDTCLPAGTLILTEHGFIPIEQVHQADRVLTDDGTWHEVLNTMERDADDYTSIKVHGLPIPIESTTNHPYEVVPQEQIKSCWGSTGKCKTYPRHSPDERGICKRCGKPVDFTARWTQAADIRIHDYLKAPIDTCSEHTTVGVDFAYLAGQYVGDGCMLFTHYGHNREKEEGYARGVSFSCSASSEDAPILDKLLKIIPRICGTEAAVIPESGGKRAYKVDVSDGLLAHKLLSLFGYGTYHKTIDQSVFSWSRAEKSAFIAGYVDSDGYVNNGKNQSGVTIVSVNRALLLGVQRLAWSLGVPVCVGRHSSAKFIEKFNCWGKESYHITFTGCGSELSKSSVKISRASESGLKEKINGPTILLHGGHAYLRVTACSSWIGDSRRVYNLEVADRHTYIAEGISVHNCSLCGHVAHTEDEHCDHVKHHAGEWDEDGNVICMISDKGVYHDISRVHVPAERIAFSIKKVASGAGTELLNPSVNPFALRCMLKTAGAIKRYDTVKKLAAIEKRILAEAQNDTLNKKLLEGFKKEAGIEDAVNELHKFIDFAHTPEVLGGLKEHKCVLNPEEFLRLIAPEQNTPKNVMIIRNGLPGIFEDIWERPDLDEFCEDDAYATSPCLDLRMLRPIKRIQPHIGIDLPRILSSILQPDLQNGNNVTIICVKRGNNDLSREYASYLTDACADLDDQEQVLALLRALTSN